MPKVLSAAFAAVLLSSVCCASAQEIERSGSTYHRAICGPVERGNARCLAHIVTDSAGNAIANGKAPAGGYGPPDLRDAYKITTNGDSSTAIAIVEAFGYINAESDLAVYRAQFGLPPCTTANGCFKKLNQKGLQRHYPRQDLGWAEESAVGLDMASAMCPDCQIWLVESNVNSMKSLASATNTAARLGAHVISNAYGADAINVPRHIKDAYRHAGIAITAASSVSGHGADYFPASSPFVTAVGGTHLVRDGSARGWSETAFGAGICTNYRKPKWQTDTGCATRTVVDVAAVADPATGVAVYGPNGGGASTWLEFGGVSVATPIIAGVYGANGGTVKYGSDPYAHPEALFDITSGSGGDCNPEYLCNGEPGYDGSTGMGTPNGVGAFGN